MLKKTRIALSAYASDQSGAILPMAVVMMTLVLGAAGLGVDVGMWNVTSRNLQSAADAAAIAGAWEIQQGLEDNVEEAALKEAVENGYVDVAGNVLDIELGENDDGETTVTATIRQKGQKYLSGFVNGDDVYIGVTATATVLEVPGDFCMLSLDPAASGALKFNGNVSVDSVGCGLAVNSSHPTAALNVNGGAADINVGDVAVVGGIDGAESINASSIDTGVRPFDDPYEDLSIPAGNGCTTAQVNAGPARPNDFPLTKNAQGVYRLCGGLQVKSSDDPLELEPGVYIVDGGDIDIKGTVTGTGVTLILTKTGTAGKYGDVKIGAGATFNISAPNEDDSMPEDFEEYTGVAIYQDRNAPDQVQCNSMYGSVDVVVSGTMYFPSRCLDIGGGSGASGAPICSRIIAQTITLYGNPNMANDCEGSGVEDIERAANVRLTL